MKRTQFIAGSLLLLLLSACGGSEEVETSTQSISGAKAGIYSLSHIGTTATKHGVIRPGAPLGIYTALFISQGTFMGTQSAQKGIEAVQSIIAGQTQIETSETFAILKELGATLQVDVSDILNRSDNRPETLDTYVRSLENIGRLAERKQTELQTREESLDEEKDEKRKELRERKSELDDVLDAKQYDQAGVLQEQVTALEEELATIDIEIDQHKDTLDIYEELLEVAAHRLEAIAVNRAIILAGLKVVDIPGVEDLSIVESEGGILSLGRTRNRSRGGGGLFGPL